MTAVRKNLLALSLLFLVCCFTLRAGESPLQADDGPVLEPVRRLYTRERLRPQPECGSLRAGTPLKREKPRGVPHE